MRIMFRLGGSTKRPMPVVQYIDRPVDRIVERIVEKRIEVPAVVESHVCDLFDNIHFAFDKDVITSESEITLDKIADLLKSYPDNNFLITGYTDARGSDNYNIDLSKRRAKAVYSALLKRQVPQHMLKWRGVGYHASSVPASGPDKVRMGDRKVSIDSGEYQNVHIEKDKMVLIPQHVDNKIEVTYDAKCLLLFWNKDIRVCDKVYMNSLSSYKERKKEMCVLPIRDPLQAVLNSIVAYLYAKMQCKHMHLIKQQEVLLVLRGYYTKKELFTFFSSILGNTGHFEDFVMNNYRKVKSVKEFAGLYCTSERSFNRKFQNCFKESPYQWMQKKKAELIREKNK